MTFNDTSNQDITDACKPFELPLTVAGPGDCSLSVSSVPSQVDPEDVVHLTATHSGSFGFPSDIRWDLYDEAGGSLGSGSGTSFDFLVSDSLAGSTITLQVYMGTTDPGGACGGYQEFHITVTEPPPPCSLAWATNGFPTGPIDPTQSVTFSVDSIGGDSSSPILWNATAGGHTQDLGEGTSKSIQFSSIAPGFTNTSVVVSATRLGCGAVSTTVAVRPFCSLSTIQSTGGPYYPEAPAQFSIDVAGDADPSSIAWGIENLDGTNERPLGTGPTVSANLAAYAGGSARILASTPSGCDSKTLQISVLPTCEISITAPQANSVIESPNDYSLIFTSTRFPVITLLNGDNRIQPGENVAKATVYLPNSEQVACSAQTTFRYIPNTETMNPVPPIDSIVEPPPVPGVDPTDPVQPPSPGDTEPDEGCPDNSEPLPAGVSGNPVHLASGQKFFQELDGWFGTPCDKNFRIYRYYRSNHGNPASRGSSYLHGNWKSIWEHSVEAVGGNLIEDRADFSLLVFRGDGLGGFLPNDRTGDVASWINEGEIQIRRMNGSFRTYGMPAGRLVAVGDRNGNTSSLRYTTSGHLQDITDPVGRIVTFETDEVGRITSVSMPGELGLSVWTYRYSPAGFLAAIEDPLGNALQYAYDSLGRVTSRTNAGGYQRAWIYDEEGRVVRRTDENGGTESFEYFDDHTTVTEEGGAVWSFYFDPSGRIVRRAQPDGTQETYEYNDIGLLVGHVDESGRRQSFAFGDLLNGSRTSPTGLQKVWTRQPGTGRITSVTEVDGSTTNSTFDDHGNLLTLTTSTGETTTYTYNHRGQVLTTTDPDDGVTTYTYDAYGNRIQTTDPLGHTTRYEYDSLSRVTAVIDPDGKRTETEYLLHNIVKATVDPAGRRQETTYDALFRPIVQTDVDGSQTHTTYQMVNGMVLPTATTDPAGRVTAFEYDADGRRIATIAPNGARSQTVYDNRGRVVKSINALGAVTQTVYNPDGSVQKIIGPLGAETQFFYDDEGRQVKVRDALGNETQTVYNPRGFVVKTIAADGAETKFEHDSLGRVVKTINALGQVTQNHYNQAGQLERTIGIGGETTTFEYDPLGRQVKVMDANGNFTQTIYNSLGQIERTIDPEGRETRFEYDSLGRQVKVLDGQNNETVTTYNLDGTVHSVTDPNGHTREFRYDILDRVVETIDPLGHSVKTEYDLAGNRSKLIDENGNVTGFEYDLLGRLVAVVNAKGERVTHTYDAAGRRTTSTNSRGQVATFTYDGLGRLTGKAMPGGTESYSYDEVGRRTMAANSAAEDAYSFDLLGRVLSKMDLRSFGVLREYSEKGDLSKVTLTTGKTIEMEYDSLHRLTKLTDPEGRVTEYTYGKAGQELTRATPETVTTREYDSLGRLVKLEHHGRTTGKVLVAYEYRHDSVGNRVSEKETRGHESVTTHYSYDARDQLTSAEVQGHPRWKGFRKLSYTYDPAGNRLTKTEDGKTERYRYNELNELIEKDGQPVEYDADGNMTSEPVGHKKVRKYAWDTEGNLTATWVEKVKKDKHHHDKKCGHWRDDEHGKGPNEDEPEREDLREFFYDADGLKVAVKKYADGKKERLDSTEQRFWFGGQVVEERTLDKKGEEQEGRFYVRGNGTLLSAYEWEPVNPKLCEKSEHGKKKGHHEPELPPEPEYEGRHYLTDALGSTIATYEAKEQPGKHLGHEKDKAKGRAYGHHKDPLGKLELYSYTPFGEMTEGDREESFTFTSLRNEDVGEEGELYSAQYRHLRPGLGRWVKRDPAGFVDGANLYLYGENGPTFGTDPSGLVFVAIGTEGDVAKIAASLASVVGASLNAIPLSQIQKKTIARLAPGKWDVAPIAATDVRREILRGKAFDGTGIAIPDVYKDDVYAQKVWNVLKAMGDNKDKVYVIGFNPYMADKRGGGASRDILPADGFLTGGWAALTRTPTTFKYQVSCPPGQLKDDTQVYSETHNLDTILAHELLMHVVAFDKNNGMVDDWESQETLRRINYAHGLLGARAVAELEPH